MPSDDPSNAAVRAFLPGGSPVTVVPRCCLCGGLHVHGHETELWEGDVDRSHRVAHCGPSDRHDAAADTGGYYLWLVDDTEYDVVYGERGSGTIVLPRSEASPHTGGDEE